MRVFVLAPIYPVPWHQHSGIFIRQFVDGLRGRGNTVDVVRLTSFWEPIGARLGWQNFIGAHEPDWKGTDAWLTRHWAVPRLTHSRFWRFNRQMAARRVKKFLSGKPSYDVYYGHFFQAAHILRLALGSHGCERLFVCLGESNVSEFSGVADVKEVQKTLSACERIICVSQENASVITHRFPEMEKKVTYIPNGVDLHRFARWTRKEAREKLGIPTDLTLVSCVGQFTERKGGGRVLKAIRLFKDPSIKGVFLGSGPDPIEGEGVFFAGPVGREEVPLWLAACDMFALPSLREGMSNAILEGAAAGLPLIVSDRPFNREFLAPDQAVFVDPDSVESIMAGLSRVLTEPLVAASLAAHSRVVAQAHSYVRRLDRIVAVFSRNL